jgi:hypothetical protein
MIIEIFSKDLGCREVYPVESVVCGKTEDETLFRYKVTHGRHMGQFIIGIFDREMSAKTHKNIIVPMYPEQVNLNPELLVPLSVFEKHKIQYQ